MASAKAMVDLVSLGEIMLRYSPPRYKRLRQARSLDVNVCGAQFNVAANLASLGKHSMFVTKLPANELGLLAQSMAVGLGVDMSHVQFVPGARMGVIYVDFAVEPRRSQHIYDRENSAASTLGPQDFDWSHILAGARLAHVDGIFPGVSHSCHDATLAYLDAARAVGCTVCFDVNYRETIWRPEQAKSVFEDILGKVDILVTNRSISESLFGYDGDDLSLMSRYRDRFGCQVVCLTYREMESASRGQWRSVALCQDQLLQGRRIAFEVVDRFGAGDAFVAGLLCGYLAGDVQWGLDLGDAMCALSHTTEGDAAGVSLEEVKAVLAEGYTSAPRR
jgi:2-dehydro-3-deoxygluconokinase